MQDSQDTTAPRLDQFPRYQQLEAVQKVPANPDYPVSAADAYGARTLALVILQDAWAALMELSRRSGVGIDLDDTFSEAIKALQRARANEPSEPMTRAQQYNALVPYGLQEILAEDVTDREVLEAEAAAERRQPLRYGAKISQRQGIDWSHAL